jgi:hypothetical protein
MRDAKTLHRLDAPRGGQKKPEKCERILLDRLVAHVAPRL